MPRSPLSFLQACCPTLKASLSQTSPLPCRLVHTVINLARTEWHFLQQCVLGLYRSSPLDTTAAYVRAKWASLPCGTFLLQTPTIDLFCLSIFIAVQQLCPFPVSLYILSFSTIDVFLFFHTLELYFCVSSISPTALILPSLCHPPSLSVRSSVPCVSMLYISDGWPFLVWRLLSLEQYVSSSSHLCVLYLVLPPLGGECSNHSFSCCCVYFSPTKSDLWKFCPMRIFKLQWLPQIL